MLKFLRNLAAMMLVAVLTYVVCLCLAGDLLPHYLLPNLTYKKENSSHTYTRLREVKTVSDVDVLFIGASFTYRSFDTRYLDTVGLKSFNLGTSGQTPIQTEMLLEQHLTRLKPEVVVTTVTPDLLRSDGVGAMIDILPGAQFDWSIWERVVSMRNWKVWNTAIYSCYRSWMDGPTFEWPLPVDGSSYVSGGYTDNPDARFTGGLEAPLTDPFLDNQLRAVKRVDDLLRSSGAEVIYVQAPVTQKLLARGEEREAMNAVYGPLGGYTPASTFDLGLVDTLHFADANHLNSAGAGVFTKAFIDQFGLLSKR